MSSSNLVQIASIEETTYGETPGAGNFDTVRFISEALSGSPDTVESQQIRTDRLSSGQIVVGLNVGGALNFELAKEDVIDKYIASAMYNDWDVVAQVVVDLTYSSVAKTLVRASGDWSADGIVVGDVLTLSGFVATVNNTQVMVTSVDSATQIKIAGPVGLTTEAGSGTAFKRADKLTIGTTRKSFTIEKKFLDLTDKGIVYKGAIVNEMAVNVAYGEISNGSFTFQANGYDPVDLAADFATFGRTLNAAATTDSMNGSTDMPFVIDDSSGTLTNSTIAIRSASITINNNLLAQTSIGNIAPTDFSPGTAQVSVELSVYSGDDPWDIFQSKLTQAAFALGFLVKNAGGYYGFFMPAVQAAAEDPASGGQNQDIILDLTATAKVGSNGESSLYVFRG